MDHDPNNGRTRFTRRRLIVVAGRQRGRGRAGDSAGLRRHRRGDGRRVVAEQRERRRAADSERAVYPLAAPAQLHGASPSSPPEEAQDVEAFTARLIPGTPDDPGAREACVTNYIDRKLAEHKSFATTTYFHPPFAKPAKDTRPGFADGTIYVDEDELPRYGFQSSLTPQQSYRARPRGARRILPQAPPSAVPRALRRPAGRDHRRPRGRQGEELRQADRQRILRHAPQRHVRGNVRRPDLRREPRLRRLEVDRVPRSAAELHAGRAEGRAEPAHDPEPQGDAGHAPGTRRRTT